MSRALMALACLCFLAAAAAAHHHPDPPVQPWTDRRPVVKVKERGHLQLRKRFYWQSPSYLETAPVVFPDPAPSLPPTFRR